MYIHVSEFMLSSLSDNDRQSKALRKSKLSGVMQQKTNPFRFRPARPTKSKGFTHACLSNPQCYGYMMMIMMMITRKKTQKNRKGKEKK
jgi:hypothetical protein